jgi:septum formation protein
MNQCSNHVSLFLASASPRRSELLNQLGYEFKTVIPNVEEQRQLSESPIEYVERLSRDKALAGLAMADIETSENKSGISDRDLVVIGSDTIVVLGDLVLEKPRNFADSKQMLQRLSGQAHQVMTSVAVVSKHKVCSTVVITDVWFKLLSIEEIEQYWLSGEPCDKAGSYGIQGLGGRFVTRIEGSYHAVVGLPLFETDQLLHEFL